MLVIVDDHSTCNKAKTYLQECVRRYPDKLVLKSMSDRNGPGYCRNVAIELIAEREIPVVMYNDADDIPHPRRVEVTRLHFAGQQTPTVLYSSFIPVDETGATLTTGQLTPSLAEILRAHQEGPPQGYEVWKEIGTRTGYVNLNSSTSVSTVLAVEHPFPNEMISEDSHTWMRYSGGGGFFVFDDRIPVSYRVTTDRFGSSSRKRHGEHFYSEKARVDEDGFRKSIQSALHRKTIKESEVGDLLIGFYTRLAETMIMEEALSVVDHLIRKTLSVAPELAKRVIDNNPVVSEYMLISADKFRDG